MPLPTAAHLWLTFFALTMVSGTSFAQDIKYEDRIGSNKGYDICEKFRFERITKLVQSGKLSQQQGYNIWKRIQSDKTAVTKLLTQAVAANELTQSQADRLLPLLDIEMTYFVSQHGKFGKPKELMRDRFKEGEVTSKNRELVYKRLIAANANGEIHDFDVASIMKQLYAGFDEQTATVEEVAVYRGALNPRIAQSGSEERVLQSAKMQRLQRSADYKKPSGTEKQLIKIADPADWIKDLEEPIYSGPQPGEKILPLRLLNLRGDKTGQEFDPVQLAGENLHLMFFVRESRTFGRFLGQLRRQLQSIEDNTKQPWAMSVIVSTDDVNEAEKSFAVLDQRYPKNLLVGVSKDGAAGPPAYGLDKNLTATVIVARNGVVIHNLPYVGNAFYTQPHILGAVADAMQIDHDTLRKHIGGTPGDAAEVAYGRAKRTRTEDSVDAFGMQLRTLVQTQKVSRVDAAKLLELVENEQAFKAEVDKLLKSGRISDDLASQLLSGGMNKTGQQRGTR